jgi:hypothetical protein
MMRTWLIRESDLCQVHKQIHTVVRCYHVHINMLQLTRCLADAGWVYHGEPRPTSHAVVRSAVIYP